MEELYVGMVVRGMILQWDSTKGNCMLYSINKTGYIRSNTDLWGFMEDLRGFHWDCIYIHIYIS